MGRRIVLIDDSPTTRAIARLVLAAAGYEPIACADVWGGLRVLAEPPPPCAVVVDTYLPGSDTRVVIARIRANAPGVPLIAVLEPGYSPEEILELFEPASYLVKPYAPRELVDAVQDALRSSFTW
ncbi:MAG TPA: response regulator [Armatimonadetes bacterium]|nr:response regulator [Armatimonadota bacterium]